MKNVQKYLKHNVSEAGGLAIGGFASEAINAQILSKFPTIGASMGKVFGRFTGSAIPMITGILAGLATSKIKNKKFKESADMIAKGLIGSSVVGIGNIAYNVMYGQSAPVEGFYVGPQQTSSYETQDTDFAGFVTGGNSMDGFIVGDDSMGYNDYDSADFGDIDSADFGEYVDSDEY